MFQYLVEIYAGLTQKEEFPIQQRKNDASLLEEMNQKLDASPKRAEQEREYEKPLTVSKMAEKYKKPLTVSKMIEKFEGKEWGEPGQIGHKWVTKSFVAERINTNTVRYMYPNGVWNEITDYLDGSSTIRSGSLGRGG